MEFSRDAPRGAADNRLRSAQTFTNVDIADKALKIAPLFVIVSGPAAAGKSTLCGPLATCLDLPWLSKDSIKAALRGHLRPDSATAVAVGQASVAVLLAVAARMNKGAILDCVWRGDQADGLYALPGLQIELFCRCERNLLERRYAARQRPAGYVPEHATKAALWSEDTMRPIGGRPLIEIDTGAPVDIQALARQIAETVDAHDAR